MKVIATGLKKNVEDLTDEEKKNAGAVPDDEETALKELEASGVLDSSTAIVSHNWTGNYEESTINCAEPVDGRFSCVQPNVAGLSTEEAKNSAWKSSGVSI